MVFSVGRGGGRESMVNLAREYWDILMRSHRNVRWFFVASFLSQVSMGFSEILYNLYIKTLGLPDTVAGASISAASIGGALFLVPAGILGDRFGRKRVVMTAGILSGLVALVQAFLETPVAIVAGSFVAGMIGSVIWVSILPLLAENTEPDERFHLFSVNFAVGLLAHVLGSFLAGSTAQWLSALQIGDVAAVRWTLVAGAVIGLTAIIPFSRIQETATQVQARTSRPGFRSLLAQAWGDKGQLTLIGQFTLASMFIGFGAGLVIPYLNLYFAERFAMPKAGIGMVIGLAQACTALAMFIGPAIARKIGPVKAVVAFQMASIPFLLTTGWATNVWLASGAVIVRNALMNAAGPIQDSIMMALVSERLRGLSVSCGQTMFTLGWAVMGPVSTAIVRHYGSYSGYAIVFTCTAVLYLIGSVFYGWAFGKHEGAVYQQSAQPITT
jgi:MFS family permease